MKWKFFLVLSACCLLSFSIAAGSKQAQEPAGVQLPGIRAFLDTTMLQIDEGQQQFIDAYKKLTGINLEIIQPPHQQYMEKLFIQLASGDLPDICEVYTPSMPQLIGEGVIIPLDNYLQNAKYLNSIYPTFMEAVKYKDGHIYGIQTRDGEGNIAYIRQDWLTNLGLRIPETWDEFVNVLRAFTFNDPDGDGKNNTYGYTEPLGTGGSDWDWYNRLIMLEARVDIYFKNGKWVDGFQEPAMQEALKRYRDLYAEGVIDKEFFTNKTSTARSKLYSGQVGIFTYWANHWARQLWERARDTVGENAEIVPMPPIAGQYYIRRIAPLLVITVGCKNPQFVFTNFIDKQYDKGAVQQLFTYGAEGYHWHWNRNGTAEFLPNPRDTNRNLFAKSYVPPMSIMNDWNQPMPIDPLVVPALEIFRKYARQDPLIPGGEYYAKYYAEITNTLKPEIFSKIIIGEYGIEEGLALYKEKAKALHMQDVLNELNSQ